MYPLASIVSLIIAVVVLKPFPWLSGGLFYLTYHLGNKAHDSDESPFFGWLFIIAILGIVFAIGKAIIDWQLPAS